MCSLGKQMLLVCPNHSRKEAMSMPFDSLRIAVRHLLKSPGFTATAAMMLALGVGATTASFPLWKACCCGRCRFRTPRGGCRLATFCKVQTW